MSAISEKLRLAVVDRASGCCEYCHLPAFGQVSTFPVDHVFPDSQGGPTELSNLALACPNCNAHKWAHTLGADPESRAAVLLFNPRTQQWADHFEWSRHAPELLEGKTACGRATIERLRMNSAKMLDSRRVLRLAGVRIGPAF